jgi:hypothetical protein
MAMIKLSNTGKFVGFPIYINSDHITAVFEIAAQDGGSLETHVFGGNAGNGVEWIVEESVGEVIKKINSANTCACNNK